MYFSTVMVLSSVTALPFILSYPTRDPIVLSRQTIDCTDLKAPFHESCWATLDLENWLYNPTTGWNETTKVCQGTGPGEDGAACCGPTEPWTTCFLRLAHGFPGDDCTVLNTGFCSYDSTLAVNAFIAPEVAYIVRNIYAINNFFTTWFTALEYATGNAQLTLQPIVNALDPPTSQNYDLSYMLTALTVGLALIPGIGEGMLGIDAATAAIGTALLAGLQNAPGVAKVIWPSGTTNTQNIQIAELDSYVAQLTADLGNSLNAGLALIMSDMPSFIGFAKSGAFSGSDAPSLARETNGLDAALKTYIVTLAIAGNGYRGTAYGSTTAAAFEAGSDHCDLRLFGCTCTLNANNICKASSPFGGTLGGQAWYWDSSTGNLFSIKGESPPIAEDTLLEDVISNGWSSLPLMFDNGARCTAEGQTQNPMRLNADGSVNWDCVSQLSLTAFTPCGNEACI